MWRPTERIRHALPEGGWPTEDGARGAPLFQPLRLGPVELAERTWVPAMVPWRATEEGFVTLQVLDWYRRLAQGQPGGLVVEATGVRDIPSGPLLRVGHDRFVPGLTELVDTVREASGGRTRLYEAAISDSLTHLYVRRFMMHRLKEEVRRSLRYNQPLALVMCDIDHFKKVNDTFGHPAGDVVLAEVAAVLRDGLRENVDLPGRYGGEEFILVLPNTNTEGARLVAERLRQAVERTTYDGAAQKVPSVTMSFGVAGMDPALRETPDELLSRADQALYRAKAGGRNRVELAPLPMPGGPRRTSSTPGAPSGSHELLDDEETTPTRPPAMHPISGEFPTIPREDAGADDTADDVEETPASKTEPMMAVVPIED